MKKKMDNGGKTRNRITAVSYDIYGNPVSNELGNNGQFTPQLSPTNFNLDVGNGQWVNQGLNTGSGQQYMPQSPIPMPPTPDYIPQSYSQNPNGSFAINTDYINNSMTGGARGFDAYANYNQNT